MLGANKIKAHHAASTPFVDEMIVDKKLAVIVELNGLLLGRSNSGKSLRIGTVDNSKGRKPYRSDKCRVGFHQLHQALFDLTVKRDNEDGEVAFILLRFLNGNQLRGDIETANKQA